MSKLAKKIDSTPIAPAPVRRGPANQCFALYGAGDLEDWEAVEGLRKQGHDWRQVQTHIDDLASVEKSLPLEKFRYHWRRRCFCWPEDLRR